MTNNQVHEIKTTTMKTSIIAILYLLFTNIPEPGVLLHGVLRDDHCSMQANSQLQWSFTPATGGDTVRLTTLVNPLETNNGMYSYHVLVPLATTIEECPLPRNSLLVTETPMAYVRSLSVEGSALTKVDTVYLSEQDRGTFRIWNLVW